MSKRITCPFCRAETVVGVKRVPGAEFGKFDEVEYCSLCSAVLGKAEEKKTEENSAASSPELDKLSALLGGEKLAEVTIEKGEFFKRGCRNCNNFIAHPFKAVCSATGKEADPMGDCALFTPKTEKKAPPKSL